MSAAREPHGKCLTRAGNEVPGRGSLAPETRQFRQFLNRPRDRQTTPTTIHQQAIKKDR